MTRKDKRREKYGNRPDVDSANPTGFAKLQHEAVRKVPQPGSGSEEGGAIDVKAAGPAQEPGAWNGEMNPWTESNKDEWVDKEGDSSDVLEQSKPANKAPGKIAKKLKGLQ